MSERTSLYRHFDKDGRLLYVGVSLRVINRLAQHRGSSPWYDEIARVEVEPFATRELALSAERVAVAKEKPLHNRQLQLKDPPKAERAIAAIERPLLRLNPVYRLNEAADLLRVGATYLKRLIEEGKIGYIEIRPQRNYDTPDGPRITKYYGITGWQIIEYIEHRERETKKGRVTVGRGEPIAEAFARA